MPLSTDAAVAVATGVLAVVVWALVGVTAARAWPGAGGGGSGGGTGTCARCVASGLGACVGPNGCGERPNCTGSDVQDALNCCSGRAELRGGVLTCIDTPARYDLDCWVFGSSVASGFHLRGRGNEGCGVSNCTGPGPGAQCGAQTPIDVSDVQPGAGVTRPEACRGCGGDAGSACGAYVSLLAWAPAAAPLTAPHAPAVRRIANAGRPGDCTSSILQRLDALETQSPDFVLIGLSLANENDKQHGSCDMATSTQPNQGAQFRAGMDQLIRELQARGNRVVLGGAYPGYSVAQTDESNLYLDEHWDLPLYHFHGALGDAQGNWAPGYVQTGAWANSPTQDGKADGNHPTTFGGFEMWTAIVPTSFLAFVQRSPGRTLKPAFQPRRPEWRGAGPAVRYTVNPGEVVHSFTVMATVLDPGAGVSVRADGVTYSLDEPQPDPTTGPQPQGAGAVEVQFPSAAAGDVVLLVHSFATHKVRAYRQTGAAGAWNAVGAEQDARLELGALTVTAGRLCNLCVWRSALREPYFGGEDGVRFYQGSLEVYAPLSDAQRTDNLALSLSTVQVA